MQQIIITWPQLPTNTFQSLKPLPGSTPSTPTSKQWWFISVPYRCVNTYSFRDDHPLDTDLYIFCVVTVCIIHRLTIVHNWIDKHLPAGGAPLLICLVAKMLPIRHSDPQGPQSRDRPGKLTNTGDINNKNCFRQDKTEV